MVSDPLTQGGYQSEIDPVESFMQIVCPNCATSYEIATSSLGADGRMVRCAHCKETWLATARQPAVADIEPGPTWDEAASPSGWSSRETYLQGDAGVAPEDRFATQPSEVEFALPHEMAEIAEAPPIAPQESADAPAAEPEAAPAPEAPSTSGDADEPDYFEVRRRREVRHATQRKSSFITKPRLIAAMVGILSVLILGREYVARVMPQTASLYAGIGLPVNLRGLAIEGVKGGIEQQDGVPVLVIEGTIRNVTRDPVEVPRLRFAMRNAAGAEIYSWTAMPERTVLPPGEVQSFRTRLASPPAEGREAHVRFFQRRDIVANSQR